MTSITLVYPPEALPSLRLVIPAEFLPVTGEVQPLQTSDGEDFQFSDGSTREVNPG
jgi:hypothetical protein